jgi:hypothetical protein
MFLCEAANPAAAIQLLNEKLLRLRHPTVLDALTPVPALLRSRSGVRPRPRA